MWKQTQLPHVQAAHMHSDYMKNLFHERVWGNACEMTFREDVACLDLLANGACKVPKTSRGDRWEVMGQVGADRGKCRPEHILRDRWESWHSVLVSYF